MVTRVAQLSGPSQGADDDKILQVSRGSRPGGLGNGDVVLGAEPALKSVDSLLQRSVYSSHLLDFLSYSEPSYPS